MGSAFFSRTSIKQLLGLALAIGYGVLIEVWLGWGKVLKPLLELPATLLLQMLALLFLTYIVRALRLYSYFLQAIRGRFGLALSLMLTHNVLNHLLPARLGEASLPMLLRQHLNVDLLRGTATLIWFRVLDLHCLLTVGLAVAALSVDAVVGLETFGQTLSGSGMFLLLGVFALSPLVLFMLLQRLKLSSSLPDTWIGRLLGQLLEGAPGNFPDFWLSWFWTWLTWLVKLATLAWLLSGLLNISLVAGAVGVVGGELTAVLPVHAPGGFGTYPAGILAALLPLSVPADAALAAAANTHLLLFSSALVSGAVGWLMLPKSKAK